MKEFLTLNLVYKLCKTLDQEAVLYCHWKSNVALNRSASGDNDLDILVSRADTQVFTHILYKLGFKEARASSGQHIPGILHYYGYDPDDDRFVHVHAHYQLIVGHDLTKNYHLPLERPCLESAINDYIFKISAPEFELIIFVIRMVLKYSIMDAILGKRKTPSTAMQRELEYLQNRVNLTKLHDILEQNLPSIDAILFENCIQSLQPYCSNWKRIKVREQLQHVLKAYARRTMIADICLKLRRRMTGLISRRIFGHLSRKRMKNGGAIIALIGGDGSGKSTSVDGLYTWLSKQFDTIKVHMGKPPCSLSTFALVSVSRICSLHKRLHKMKRPVKSSAGADSKEFPGYIPLLRSVCTAHDRYRLYVKSRRFATNGGLVICDRYPLPQIKLMDAGPFSQITNMEQTNRPIEFLIKIAKKYQQKIMFPELLIVLKVAPDIAVLRKIEEVSGYVKARSQEIWDLDWQQTPAYIIDASRSKEEVLSDLKSLIWSKL